MKSVCLVGTDGHGKTTLMQELIRELVSKNIRVGTIKHSGHEHELDKPGKDSHRHRAAGARPAGIITKSLAGVYWELTSVDDAFELMEPLYHSCDIVLIEGFKSGPYRKVEVFRKAAGGIPLAVADDSIEAIISDDSLDVDRPVWPRSDVAMLADKLLDLLK